MVGGPSALLRTIQYSRLTQHADIEGARIVEVVVGPSERRASPGAVRASDSQEFTPGK